MAKKCYKCIPFGRTYMFDPREVGIDDDGGPYEITDGVIVRGSLKSIKEKLKHKKVRPWTVAERFLGVDRGNHYYSYEIICGSETDAKHNEEIIFELKKLNPTYFELYTPNNKNHSKRKLPINRISLQETPQ